jgi:hypothetical protein
VRDASGVQDVKLYYRVVRDEIQGEWQVIPMGTSGNDLYSVTVGPDELRASRDPYGGLILQYYIKAWDIYGNVAETTSGNVQIQNCIR